MKRKLFFIFSIVVLSFVAIKLFGGNTEKKVLGKANETEVINQVTKTSNLEPQLVEMGAVTVKLTPVQLEPNKEVVFNLELNTHSVELAYDYTKIMKMYDQSGNNYLVKEWTGGNGGHHLSGQLIFEGLKDGVNSVILDIEEIDDQSSSFSWDL